MPAVQLGATVGLRTHCLLDVMTFTAFNRRHFVFAIFTAAHLLSVVKYHDMQARTATVH